MQQRNILSNKPYISEVFISLQGEGKFVGARQLFIRFAGCDVGCIGCDTDYKAKDFFYFSDIKYSNPANLDNLISTIKNENLLKEVHSISFTGGEPLLNIESINYFIDAFDGQTKFFLETSGFHLDKLETIYEKLDIVSIDIKLKSSFGINDNINLLKSYDFIEPQKSYFKLVVSKDISDEEIVKIVYLLKAKGFNEIYLHTKNNLVELKLLNDIMKKFYSYGIISYYVPQIHKLVGIK